MSRPILVTGATGKQGGAVIKALLASEASSDFTILAVTRNSSSPSAQALAQKSDNIKLVQGDLDDCPALFAAALQATAKTPIWGVFSVQQAIQDGATKEREEQQGQSMVDAALANGVKQFVYSSVCRSGEEPTYVPHFQSKHTIELHLKEKAAGKMDYTILRPVAFMEVFSGDFQGKVSAAWLKSYLGSKPLPLIACKDIGIFAAKAFVSPSAPEFRNQAITLAGDDLSPEQAAQLFRQRMGYNLPETFHFIATLLLWFVPELKIMTNWFNEVGYNVDINAVKKLHPEVLSLGDWFATESKYPKKA